jgi:hypothetical protein
MRAGDRGWRDPSPGCRRGRVTPPPRLCKGSLNGFGEGCPGGLPCRMIIYSAQACFRPGRLWPAEARRGPLTEIPANENLAFGQRDNQNGLTADPKVFPVQGRADGSRRHTLHRAPPHRTPLRHGAPPQGDAPEKEQRAG